MENIPKGCIEFSWEKYQEGYIPVTRDGREVKLAVKSDHKDDEDYPIFGAYRGHNCGWMNENWSLEGVYSDAFCEDDLDIFLKKKTKTLQIVIDPKPDKMGCHKMQYLAYPDDFKNLIKKEGDIIVPIEIEV